MAIPSEMKIPGRSSLGATLRNVTESLVAEIEAPTDAPPPWNEFEWGIARAAITIHGIAGILLPQLKWAAPLHWREFLTSQVAEIRDRQQRFSSALAEIDPLAIEQGIPVIALKGCALHAMGLYQAGERPMADIDLLVRARDQQAMQRLLERVGFTFKSADWKHCAYERTRASEHISLDLHTCLSERLAGRPIELTGFSFGSDAGGLRGYASKAAMMRHLLLHTAGNMGRRWVRAIHLLDIARLARQFSPVDWQELQSREWADRWCLYPPLRLAARYFAGSIDAGTLAELGVACPRTLARAARRRLLSEVSASNPRVLALPELAWCTSIGTLARYLKSRLIPRSEVLEDLARLTKSADFARGQRWFTMSHPRRIATWIFRKPIRPATLHAVRRGLEYGTTDDKLTS